MRTLGLDLGQKRIGVALSDPEGRFAFPRGFVASRGLSKDVAAVLDLIGEHDVAGVVIGLPLHLDGRAGKGAEQARRFAARLGERSGIRVELLDERWTSREASRMLQQERPRGRRAARQRKEQVDAVAASILLRTFLDRERAGAPG